MTKKSHNRRSAVACHLTSIITRFFLLLLSSRTIIFTEAAPWRFIVVADWHGGDGFSRSTSSEDENYQEKLHAFTYLYDTYGGEVMVLPGDTQMGKWWDKNYIDKVFPGKTVEEAVELASKNCYPTMKRMFNEAGYTNLIVSTGDHEYGGNGWGPQDDKTATFQQYRDGFGLGFNFDQDTGKFLYNYRIDGVFTYPKGTEYEKTSFYYRYKNALFITVDAFNKVGINLFWDRANGLGGEGVVTCTVEGKHLQWLESVLKAARKNKAIKHIFVQAHLPIIQPVRKVNCSGQFMDYGENSNFWKLMQEYNVDIYFAGEVHANTATKDPNSNLVQVVSRGNRLNNFIAVDITENTITLSQYNEIEGNSTSYNLNYEQFGSLVIDKSDPNQTTFSSSGSLTFLNREAPILHYDFESLHDILDRQVLGLKEDDKSFFSSEMEIRGKTVNQAFWNKGAFAEQYDAQAGSVNLVNGVKGKAGQFNGSSRMAVFGVGPHGPGFAISVSFWIKTDKNQGNFILFCYGQSFGGEDSESNKDAQLITLEKGKLLMYRRSNSQYVPVGKKMNLADNNWHHIAVTMPRDNCALSEVQVYINGTLIAYQVVGVDDFLFHTTSGRCSIGGFGYSSSVYEQLYPHVKEYIGLMDEFKLYTRPMTSKDIKNDSKRNKA